MFFSDKHVNQSIGRDVGRLLRLCLQVDEKVRFRDPRCTHLSTLQFAISVPVSSLFAAQEDLCSIVGRGRPCENVPKHSSNLSNVPRDCHHEPTSTEPLHETPPTCSLTLETIGSTICG